MLTMRQKQALTETVKKRYRKADKKVKGKILDELVATTGYNRSYARRLFTGHHKIGRKKKRIRVKIYDQSVAIALTTIWVAADNICSKRLKPFLPELLEILERNNEITVEALTREKLLRVSYSTIDRLLLSYRRRYRLKGKSTTKPGTLLRNAIPIRTYADWNEQSPGFFEADLVGLCGDSVKGDFVYILDLTDVFTGWQALEATMGKGQHGIHRGVETIKNRLVFPLPGLDSDNCFVEQKNFSVVRRFLGYTRRETESELNIIKEMLKLIEVYVNFFQPSLKLVSKIRVDNKTKKTYDEAKTPYQRLINSGILDQQTKQRLKEYYDSLNPMELRRKISKLNQKLDQLHRYKFK